MVTQIATTNGFKPSAYQIAIYDFVKRSLTEQRRNLVISAKAGTGKSSTVAGANMMEVIPPYMTVLYLTFMREVNLDLDDKVKHSKEVLAGRAPQAGVRTCHSIGNGCLKDIGIVGDPSKNGRKYNHLCQQYLKEHMAEYDYKLSEQLAELVNKVRLTLANTSEASLKAIIRRYNIDIDTTDEEIWPIILQAVPFILAEGIKQAQREGKFDFTDQIWLPSSKALDLQPSKYDIVMIDEAQDLSPCIRELALKTAKKNGMVISVGDKKQCQPAGTMVRLSNGSEKPIEQLQPGDTVYSFDRRSAAYVRAGLVTDTASREYNGLLYTIQAGDKSSQCTDSHKWLVRWTDGEDAYVTYLMKKENSYRVGQTQMFVNRTHAERGFSFGLAFRAKHEGADSAWVLKIHKTREEALVYEQVLSASYGIPELCFDSHNLTVFTQEMIDKVFSLLPDQAARAKKCLEDHGRKLEYPLYTSHNMNGFSSDDAIRQRQGRVTLFETQACNLISGYMAIPVAPDTISAVHDKLSWHTMNVTAEEYSGPVYSLNIARHHKYIADGLLTCNCIMGFAGASYRSLEEIKEITNAVELPLNKNYRCPKSVIRLAQTLVPEIEAWEGAEEGEVNYIVHNDVASLAQMGDMILCRYNAPLVEMAISLIKMRKRCIVKGRDLGGNVTSFLEKVTKFFQDKSRSFVPEMLYADLVNFVREYKSRMMSVLMLNEEENEGRISKLDDDCETLLALFEGYQEENEKGSYQGFVSFIENFFKEHGETTGEVRGNARKYTITLSTGHKAKGLENPNVFILGYDELPSSKAKTEEAIEQENNLLYVMITRPQKKLYCVVKEPEMYQAEKDFTMGIVPQVLPEIEEEEVSSLVASYLEIGKQYEEAVQAEYEEVLDSIVEHPIVDDPVTLPDEQQTVETVETSQSAKRTYGGRKPLPSEDKRVFFQSTWDVSIRAAFKSFTEAQNAENGTNLSEGDMLEQIVLSNPQFAVFFQQSEQYQAYQDRLARAEERRQAYANRKRSKKE